MRDGHCAMYKKKDKINKNKKQSQKKGKKEKKRVVGAWERVRGEREIIFFSFASL